VELLTQSIAAAQQANSWMGQPAQQFSQARALEQSLMPVPAVLEEMKRSAAFVNAVPSDRRPRLGLARDSRDFDLGVQYYESSPTLVAVVTKGGMAEGMGFKPGDKLISAGGRPVASVLEFKQVLKANAGRKISVAYERKGKQENKDMSVPASLPK
jgi:S1-C subfamily serine protease